MTPRSATFLLLASAAAAPARALADPSEQAGVAREDRAAEARARFDEGVALVREGRCAEAPPGDPARCRRALTAFTAAFSDDPELLGALRSKAFLERALGATASAAASFRQLIARAEADPGQERRGWARFAREDLAALEPRIPRLVIESGEQPSQRVYLDEREVTDRVPATFELNPGSHVVTIVGASGRASRVVRLAEAERVVVHASSFAPPPASPRAPAPPDGERTHGAPDAAPWSIAAGAGLVAIGLGLGAVALARRRAACGRDDVCDMDLLEEGRPFARASTVVTGVGLVTMTGGFVLLALPRREGRAAAVVLRGSF